MRLLDLYSGAGGAAMGYHRAGFEVVGVDNRPMPRYPFEFHQDDALEFLDAHGRDFDVVHASPPCQAYSATRTAWRDRDYQDLVGPTRDMLRSIGVPYVIENVVGAPLIDPVTLCGAAFGLRLDHYKHGPMFLRRHRLFESSMDIMGTECACRAERAAGCKVVGVYGGGSADRSSTRRGGISVEKAGAATVMGIDWMTRRELAQAIPPAYTDRIGRQLMATLDQGEAA